MKIIKIPLKTVWAANCYAVISDKGNAALIDAPCEPENILSALEDEKAKLKIILLTHGHFDHINAAEALKEKTGAAVYIHKNDSEKLKSEYLSVASLFGVSDFAPVSGAKLLGDGDEIGLDEIKIKVLHTPGHTSGGVCFIVGNALFSGDTLFELSVGRTDMPDGSLGELTKSLAKLRSLEGDYKVYPGHGPVTELSYERTYNPYLADRKDF